MQCAVPGKYCVRCASGYSTDTCYNSSSQVFSNVYDVTPITEPIYSYKATVEAGKNCSELKRLKETPYNFPVAPVWTDKICK
jgi:hypothetical protein